MYFGRVKRVAALLFLLPAGCISGYTGTARDLDPADLAGKDWISMTAVPFVRQADEDDCGAAALTMVLNCWKDGVSLADVTGECRRRHDLSYRVATLQLRCALGFLGTTLRDPVSPGVGLLAGVLRAYAKRRGMEAFLFPGTLDDFPDMLRKGRPLIVGMVKPHLQGNLCHYEVVVGVNPARQQIATLDPAHGLRVNSFDEFTVEWQASGRLILLVARGENK